MGLRALHILSPTIGPCPRWPQPSRASPYSTYRNKYVFSCVHRSGGRTALLSWIREHVPRNTTSTYATYAKQFLAFAAARSLPAGEAETLCLFMKDALEVRALARGTLVDVIPAAVEDIFRFEDTSPGRSDPALLQAVKRTVRRLTMPPKAKLPLLKSHLTEMARACKATEQDIRDVFMMILMFMGFLRESEAAALLHDDVWIGELEGFEGPVLFINVRMSKTDQTHENATIVLCGSAASAICPIRWFRLFQKVRRGGTHLFHQSNRGSVSKLAPASPNSILKKWLERIGIDPRRYGSHSLRRGGATAASRARVKTHVLKRHGRWLSDAVYLYIIDSVQDTLGVARAILAA